MDKKIKDNVDLNINGVTILQKNNDWLQRQETDSMTFDDNLLKEERQVNK
jgi:hypothetical protein